MAWIIHIEARRPDQGCFATYWQAAELGEAVASALRHAAGELELREARVSSVADAPDVPPEGFLDSGGGLFAAENIHCWSPSAEDTDFALPAGVVFARDGSRFDVDEMVEARAAGAEPDYCWAELVVDGRRLRDVFLAHFADLPLADALEIRILGHWDDVGRTQLWIGDDERFRGIAIWRFLEEHWSDLVENGFVEVAVYAREVDAILRLTEHKLLLLTSGDSAPRDRFVERSQALGYGETRPYRSVDADCAHYHYRPPGSRSRSQLLAALASWGLREMDSWQEQATLLGDEAADAEA